MNILDEVNAIGNNPDPHYIFDAHRMKNKITIWLKNPQNDCLRARGDKRWIEMCEADHLIDEILEPF